MTRTGLLIIDMQNDVAHPDGRMFIRDAAHRAETMALVLQTFREVRAPVIHAVRSHRSDGWDAERFRLPSYHADRGSFVEGSWGRQVLDRLTPEPGEPIVIKRRFSAFMGTELDLLLRIPRQKGLLRGLQDVRVLRAEVAARGMSGGRCESA